jgi:ubiquinone biosynthesis protein
MIDWNILIDEADIASVLPEAYAHYRRPIKRALTVFLAGLSTAQQEAVLADQAMLPATATLFKRVGQLVRSCPALHKLGQTLARDRRLLPALRIQLQRLESLPPSIPLSVIGDTLSRELGPLERLGVSLHLPALAEASVAVVVPFRANGGEDGVFKILKPGIEERLTHELSLLERVGTCLDEECEALGVPRLDYRDTAAGLVERLRHEIRLDIEQCHLAAAGATYANDPRIQIPALFPFCTPRVTAMERVHGVKVTDHGFDGDQERRACAELLVGSLIARPILSVGDAALFHGDPHAGNLLFTQDRRLAILDWSLATTLDEPRRVAFVQLALGAVTLDAARIAEAFVALSEPGSVHLPTVMPMIDAALGRLRQIGLPGLLWLIDLLDSAVQVGVRFDATMLLMRKMLLTLEGIVADLGADRSCIDTVMLGDFFARIAFEWPYRWLSLPHSRAFATRLSNADLAGAMMRMPQAAMRYWLGLAARR